MIVRDYYRLSHPDAPIAASYGTRAKCEEWRDRNPCQRPIETYRIDPVPCCGCCGDDFSAVRERGGSIATYSGSVTRCDRHWERNPCAVPGCSRTSAARERDGGPGHWLADDQIICAEHWRRYVPPRSRERRLYHRHFRRAKKLGWNDDRIASFYAFWNRLVQRVRARATEGHLDEAEINRLFGWSADD
jgi:hypothetical protein